MGRVEGSHKWIYTTNYTRPNNPDARINLGALIKLQGDKNRTLHWHAWGRAVNCPGNSNEFCGVTTFKLEFNCRDMNGAGLATTSCSGGWVRKGYSPLGSYLEQNQNILLRDNSTYYVDFVLKAKMPSNNSVERGKFHSRRLKCTTSGCKF